MSDVFVWKDGYSIGVEEVDAQHRNLFHMANRLQDDLPPGELEELLMELYRHTREHFKAEEALMRDSAYPYYLEHRGQHDVLLEDLNRMAAEVVKDSSRLPAFRDLVADWVKKHILNHDQGIAAYLRLG